jgi:hypothetical protein
MFYSELQRGFHGTVSLEVVTMYLRLAFWTGAIAYITFLFARFDLSGGRSSSGVTFTASLFGAMLGFALGGMFAHRVNRKIFLR